ncbi:MAG: HipA N-terminal domain-containing protein [Bacteroidales bacterium]|jgi:serine/threonine-protein kinase HipA|nr:HipA N-terminal domain-containing protein [Bacteroidales bacterium]
MRKANVYMHRELAGVITETTEGYSFIYDVDYLARSSAQPVSLTLPLQNKPFTSSILFPFFDGLITEGWLLHIAKRNWKLNARDRVGLLLASCHDCIGAVSIEEEK